MKTLLKVTLCSLAILLLLIPLMVGAENQQIASVTTIDGTLFVSHENDTEWSEATKDMPLYLNDSLQTAEGSYANIDFVSGGVVSINENTTIQLTGTQEVTDVTDYSFIQKVYITSGEIWAKITQQDQKMEFETSDGVVAIKGTEFVIETGEDGTKVSLLDGVIEFLDNMGTVTSLVPGNQISAALNQVPVLDTFSIGDLRNTLEGNFPNLYNVQNLLNNLDVNPPVVPTPATPNVNIPNNPSPF